MLSSLSEKFESAMRRLSGQGRISESNVREAMEEVRTALLEADVHYEVVEEFTDRVLQQAVGEQVLGAVKPGEQMIKLVHDELVRLLGGAPEPPESHGLASMGVEPEGAPPEGAEEAPPIRFVEPGPTIIMMCGLQGSGKTTTCGKLAAHLKKKGKSTMLAAADLQRPAAVTQLETLARQVNEQQPGTGRVRFYGEPEKVAEYGQAVGAAVDVCRHAVEAAKQSGDDVLILDTAGRLHINDSLMDELHRVSQAVQPPYILLVIDAMTGQDAVNSARAFNDRLELDGVILTKFDSDTRGGAALSVKQITGKPVKYMGTGETLDAIEEFHPRRVAGRILGMGDVVSLVERAQEQVSEEEALSLQEKMAAGNMTMDDFLKQLKNIRRMGSMKQLLGMLPGVGSQIKDLPLDDRQIDRTEAIIQSMTPGERRDADLLNNSRRRRVARGSGSEIKEVSQLVKGFDMVSNMSQQLSGMGGMSQMKAMTGMGGQEMAALSGGGGASGRGAARSSKPKFKKRKKRRR